MGSFYAAASLSSLQWHSACIVCLLPWMNTVAEVTKTHSQLLYRHTCQHAVYAALQVLDSPSVGTVSPAQTPLHSPAHHTHPSHPLVWHLHAQASVPSDAAHLPTSQSQRPHSVHQYEQLLLYVPRPRLTSDYGRVAQVRSACVTRM